MVRLILRSCVRVGYEQHEFYYETMDVHLPVVERRIKEGSVLIGAESSPPDHGVEANNVAKQTK